MYISCDHTCTYLFPCTSGVGLSSRVYSILELTKMHQCGSKTCKVTDVVKKQFGSFIHCFIITSLTNLYKEVGINNNESARIDWWRNG